MVKNLPNIVFITLKRHLTTKLVIASSNEMFFHTLKWIDMKFSNKNFRTIKLSSNNNNFSQENILSIGYGTHFFWYEKRFFIVNFIKESSDKDGIEKEILEFIDEF